jgi:predicted HNH restriction endonuclease
MSSARNDDARSALERARREAAKCVLLCHNCHAMVGDGAITLS